MSSQPESNKYRDRAIFSPSKRNRDVSASRAHRKKKGPKVYTCREILGRVAWMDGLWIHWTGGEVVVPEANLPVQSCIDVLLSRLVRWQPGLYSVVWKVDDRSQFWSLTPPQDLEITPISAHLLVQTSRLLHSVPNQIKRLDQLKAQVGDLKTWRDQKLDTIHTLGQIARGFDQTRPTIRSQMLRAEYFLPLGENLPEPPRRDSLLRWYRKQTGVDFPGHRGASIYLGRMGATARRGENRLWADLGRTLDQWDVATVVKLEQLPWPLAHQLARWQGHGRLNSKDICRVVAQVNHFGSPHQTCRFIEFLSGIDHEIKQLDRHFLDGHHRVLSALLTGCDFVEHAVPSPKYPHLVVPHTTDLPKAYRISRKKLFYKAVFHHLEGELEQQGIAPAGKGEKQQRKIVNKLSYFYRGSPFSESFLDKIEGLFQDQPLAFDPAIRKALVDELASLPPSQLPSSQSRLVWSAFAWVYLADPHPNILVNLVEWLEICRRHCLPERTGLGPYQMAFRTVAYLAKLKQPGQTLVGLAKWGEGFLERVQEVSFFHQYTPEYYRECSHLTYQRFVKSHCILRGFAYLSTLDDDVVLDLVTGHHWQLATVFYQPWPKPLATRFLRWVSSLDDDVADYTSSLMSLAYQLIKYPSSVQENLLNWLEDSWMNDESLPTVPLFSVLQILWSSLSPNSMSDDDKKALVAYFQENPPIFESIHRRSLAQISWARQDKSRQVKSQMTASLIAAVAAHCRRGDHLEALVELVPSIFHVHHQTLALGALGERLGQLGWKDKAKKLLKQAEGWAGKIQSNSTRWHILARLAGNWCQSGERDRGMKVAGQVERSLSSISEVPERGKVGLVLVHLFWQQGEPEKSGILAGQLVDTFFTNFNFHPEFVRNFQRWVASDHHRPPPDDYPTRSYYHVLPIPASSDGGEEDLSLDDQIYRDIVGELQSLVGPEVTADLIGPLKLREIGKVQIPYEEIFLPTEWTIDQWSSPYRERLRLIKLSFLGEKHYPGRGLEIIEEGLDYLDQVERKNRAQLDSMFPYCFPVGHDFQVTAVILAEGQPQKLFSLLTYIYDHYDDPYDDLTPSLQEGWKLARSTGPLDEIVLSLTRKKSDFVDLFRLLEKLAQLSRLPQSRHIESVFPEISRELEWLQDSGLPSELEEKGCLLANYLSALGRNEWPKEVAKLLGQRHRWERERAALEEKESRGDLPEKARYRLESLRDKLDETQEDQRKWRDEVEKKLDKHLDLLEFQVVKEGVDRLISNHWESVLGGEMEGDGRDWENALALYRHTDENQRLLKKILSRQVKGEEGWRYRLPSNVQFLDKLKEKGIDGERWKGPWKRVWDTPLGRWTVYEETDPLQIFHMGNLFDTCLSVDGCNAFSTIANAVEINKKVLFIQDETGRVIGRKLVVINGEGILFGYRTYWQPLPGSEDRGHPWIYLLFSALCLDMAWKCGLQPANDKDEKEVREKDLTLFAEWYDDGTVPFVWWVRELGREKPRSRREVIEKYEEKLKVELDEESRPIPQKPRDWQTFLWWLGDDLNEWRKEVGL